jgi:hypothetical protein
MFKNEREREKKTNVAVLNKRTSNFHILTKNLITLMLVARKKTRNASIRALSNKIFKDFFKHFCSNTGSTKSLPEIAGYK